MIPDCARSRAIALALLLFSSGCITIRTGTIIKYSIDGVDVEAPFNLGLRNESGLGVYRIEGARNASIFLRGDIMWDPNRLDPVQVIYFSGNGVQRTLFTADYPEDKVEQSRGPFSPIEWANTSAPSGLLVVLWSNASQPPNITVQPLLGGRVVPVANGTNVAAFDLEAFAGTSVRSPQGGIIGNGHAEAPFSGDAVVGVVKILRPLAGNANISDEIGKHEISLDFRQGGGHRVAFVGAGKLSFDFQAQTIQNWRFVVVLGVLPAGILPAQTWAEWDEPS